MMTRLNVISASGGEVVHFAEDHVLHDGVWSRSKGCCPAQSRGIEPGKRRGRRENLG
jgi:hypothetical protein